jgi:hypothetical protein
VKEVGIILGSARPERIQFTAREMVRVGEYLVAETLDGPVLYMVDKFENVSVLSLKDWTTSPPRRRGGPARSTRGTG